MENSVDYELLVENMVGKTVPRPNSATNGTLSGHAAGEPFEKNVYNYLKNIYPNNIFKQYEYLNDLYLKNPMKITAADRASLLDSPTILFLLSRGEKATEEWNPNNIFKEKQNDTADILFHNNGFYDLIDVKTRNQGKNAQAPNIISSYKLAKACSIMIDNAEYDSFAINYVEIDWREQENSLKCTNAHHANIFKSNPINLYINWAAAMQIQFHVSDLEQDWNNSKRDWAYEYIRMFVQSAKQRCDRMLEMYVKPFEKYI
ncbi:MAG: HincII family type II restriction endonuclease [Paludibacteraceae bacterium]|nr:HincII family type II restriction endonuclease [Paludibacteraceae bacterium]